MNVVTRSLWCTSHEYGTILLYKIVLCISAYLLPSTLSVISGKARFCARPTIDSSHRVPTAASVRRSVLLVPMRRGVPCVHHLWVLAVPKSRVRIRRTATATTTNSRSRTNGSTGGCSRAHCGHAPIIMTHVTGVSVRGGIPIVSAIGVALHWLVHGRVVPTTRVMLIMGRQRR